LIAGGKNTGQTIELSDNWKAC